MTLEEARLILDAHTLGDGGAAVDDAKLRQAQELMRNDADLRQWFAARQATDRKLAEAMAAVELPALLRERLRDLAPPPAASVLPFPARRNFLLALAAALAAAFTGVLWYSMQRAPEMPQWQSDSLAMVRELDSGKARLDHQTHSLQEIRGFLASAKAPEPQSLPPNLPTHPPVGCKFFHAAGLPSSVVCFEVAPGVLAHLVTISAGPEKSGAVVGKPQFAANGNWHTAVWSDGKQTYVLGTRAEMDQLKKLFG